MANIMTAEIITSVHEIMLISDKVMSDNNAEFILGIGLGMLLKQGHSITEIKIHCENICHEMIRQNTKIKKRDIS